MTLHKKRYCVFCGSSPGARPEFAEAARAFGRALALRDIGIVYGGASVGVMAAVADAALEAGGDVIGVIPKGLFKKEIAHTNLTELHVVATMHERKALMAELSEGFIALPGGIGTLEEFFEVLTWAQLGIHYNPCGLLNVGGFFDSLLGFLNQCVNERFVRPDHHAMIIVESEPESLLDKFDAYSPPKIEKWLDRSES